VTPTPCGEALAFRLTRVLHELRNIADLRAIEGVSAGRIAIGALPLCRAQLLPMAVASLVRKHPRVRVSTVESPYESLIAGLRSSDIDLIVGALRSPIDIPDLEQHTAIRGRACDRRPCGPSIDANGKCTLAGLEPPALGSRAHRSAVAKEAGGGVQPCGRTRPRSDCSNGRPRCAARLASTRRYDHVDIPTSAALRTRLRRTRCAEVSRSEKPAHHRGGPAPRCPTMSGRVCAGRRASCRGSEILLRDKKPAEAKDVAFRMGAAALLQ
jgi:hypothetical protein